MQKIPITQLSAAELKALIIAYPTVNLDVFNRLQYLFADYAYRLDRTHFLAITHEQKIIAAGSVQPAYGQNDELWLSQISVDPAYKNQGHGKRILKSIFKYAAEKKLILAPSSFEHEGYKYLAPIMPRIHHEEYPDLKIRYAHAAPIMGHNAYVLKYAPTGEIAARPAPISRFRMPFKWR